MASSSTTPTSTETKEHEHSFRELLARTMAAHTVATKVEYMHDLYKAFVSGAPETGGKAFRRPEQKRDAKGNVILPETHTRPNTTRLSKGGESDAMDISARTYTHRLADFLHHGITVALALMVKHIVTDRKMRSVLLGIADRCATLYEQTADAMCDATGALYNGQVDAYDWWASACRASEASLEARMVRAYLFDMVEMQVCSAPSIVLAIGVLT